MGFLKWLVRVFGFNKNSAYQKKYLNETNIRTAAYMAFVVLVLEMWMIIRYVDKRPGSTFFDYFDGETNYLILFSAALVITVFSLRYTDYIKNRTLVIVTHSAVLALDISMLTRFIYVSVKESEGVILLWDIKYLLILFVLSLMALLSEFLYFSKNKKSDVYGQFLNVLFALICLGFGIETSIYDLSKGRQILCFMTMMLFAACTLIWKPYVSMLMLGATFLYFYHLWYPHLLEADLANNGRVLEGDKINFFMLWIVIVIISISIYNQRVLEAEKDEELIDANKELERVAVEDDLTGIRNLFYFNQEAEKMLKDPSVDISEKIFFKSTKDCI